MVNKDEYIISRQILLKLPIIIFCQREIREYVNWTLIHHGRVPWIVAFGTLQVSLRCTL